MEVEEKIAQLESVLDHVDRAYNQLFEMGFTQLGNTLLNIAESLEMEIMDLEDTIREE